MEILKAVGWFKDNYNLMLLTGFIKIVKATETESGLVGFKGWKEGNWKIGVYWIDFRFAR